MLLWCILAAVFLPLLSFVFSWMTSDRYSWLVSLNAPLMLLCSAIFSVIAMTYAWNEGPMIYPIEWFSIGKTPVTANLFISNTTVLLLAVVSVVSFLVHLYSVGYMAGDNDIRKYFAMLGFFTFSMQGIVLSDNLLMTFFFWELVGFSSYLLIGHWTERPDAGNAARKAFIMNRIGDAAFLMGIMIVWTNAQTLEISRLVFAADDGGWRTTASLLIFGGVIGKSAQFPLFTWLPDAMEGPTPVSAFIHAATMVAAGVYLMIRIFPLFTTDALTVVAIIGMITAVIGALGALFQFDIKRILAYSTVSQLGLMIMAIGLGIVQAALLHLITHAFFKACLFLSAGSVIHALHLSLHRAHFHFDVQDLRNMGGLHKKLPTTFVTFVVSGASLSGIPFFSGFLSKEAMVAALWMNPSLFSLITLVVMISVSFITVLYTFRLIWLVFMGDERRTGPLSILEAPVIMRVPAVLLAVASLWLIVSWNPFDFMGWLHPPAVYTHLEWLTGFSIIFVLLALWTAHYIYRLARFDKNEFLQNGLYVDTVYRTTVVRLTLLGATATSYIDRNIVDRSIHGLVYVQVTFAHMVSWFDKALVDGIVNLIASIAQWAGSLIRSFQGGKVQRYIFWAVLTLIIFLIWTVV